MKSEATALPPEFTMNIALVIVVPGGSVRLSSGVSVNTTGGETTNGAGVDDRPDGVTQKRDPL